MTSRINVKICGLTEAEHVAAAVEAGARYLGFVFFAKSPRNITVKAAASLVQMVPPAVAKVALVVNADNAMLDALCAEVPLDFLQLHGDESPTRVAAIRARYGVPVMKAVGIADASDLSGLEAYSKVSDQLLIDAKPVKNADMPGGNGLAFDWPLIAGREWPIPWMLAGGLTPENVVEAIRLTGARQVDVSSGVEAAPGTKDANLIRAFIKAAQFGAPSS